MAKNPTELYAVLDAEAPKFTDCAIVVRFQKAVAFVPVVDPNRLAELTDYQNAGGVAVGFFGIAVKGGRDGVATKIFSEYEKIPAVQGFMAVASGAYFEEISAQGGLKTSKRRVL